MPLPLTERAPEPEGINVTPADARPYLADFIWWLRWLLNTISINPNATDINEERFFESQVSEFLPAALEVNMQSFERLAEAILNADTNLIRQHGLYGAQLKWKLANVNRPLSRFINEQRSALLKRILASADSLLSSILSAVPGPGALAGSALAELKEAVENSTKIRE